MTRLRKLRTGTRVRCLMVGATSSCPTVGCVFRTIVDSTGIYARSHETACGLVDLFPYDRGVEWRLAPLGTALHPGKGSWRGGVRSVFLKMGKVKPYVEEKSRG